MTLTPPHLKRLIWFALVPTALTLSVLGLGTLSSLYSYFQRARVVESALNLAQPRGAGSGVLSWQPDSPETPRRMEAFTREAVTRDYLLGFEELTYSLFTGEGAGLRSYFQEGALADAHLAATSPARTKFTDWDHRLTLHFYAPDGATVAFSDTYRYAQGVLTGGDLADVRIAERSLDVIMTLDDGTWRVHHWRVTRDEAAAFDAPTFPDLAAALERVRGVNYTPRSAPFDAFWPNFNPAEVDADFAAAADLGLNTVRFFIPYPAPEGLEANLPLLLSYAERHNLRLIPTLLDGYTRYALEDLPEVHQHLKSLSAALRHPQVLAVDVKNEADRDFETAGLERTRAFLSHVLDVTRQLSSKPVLVGLIEPDPVLAQNADVISLHHYDPEDAMRGRLEGAKTFGKPVLLEEFGFHSWPLKLPDPHSEAEQAWYYQQVLDAAEAESVGWLAWTLYDLPRGKMPGGRAVERHLGILRADGNAKAVARVLSGTRAAPPTLGERLRKGRFLPAGFLGCGLLVVTSFVVAKRRRKGSV